MKLLKKLLALLLIISLTIFAGSCDNGSDNNDDPPTVDNGDSDNNSNDIEKDPDGDNNENPEPQTATYTVTVTNPFGKPISGVTVFIHKDGGADYNVCATPAVTDDEGKVSFTLDTAFTYSVQVQTIPSVYSAPDGYLPAERYRFNGYESVVTLDFSGVVPASYEVGDPIANFTLTDIDGNSYELAELLETKKMVMLNFWFYKCDPCALEFPALNTAYNKYSDKIEVLAIDDCDSLSYVQGYESYRGFTLDMPLFCVGYDTDVSNERFGAKGWPTTVIIDRYGIVSYIHVGAVTSTSAWEDLFAYYTSDSYDGEVVESVNDVQ